MKNILNVVPLERLTKISFFGNNSNVDYYSKASVSEISELCNESELMRLDDELAIIKPHVMCIHNNEIDISCDNIFLDATVIALIGKTGAGKSVVEKELVATLPVGKIISGTTRTPREGEVNGVDYHFMSTVEFLIRMAEGEFLEDAVVFGNRYGVLNSEIKDGGIYILVVEEHGLKQIKEKMGGRCISIMLVASFEERYLRTIDRDHSAEELLAMEERFRNEDKMFNNVETDATVSNEDGGLEVTVDFIKEFLKERGVVNG